MQKQVITVVPSPASLEALPPKPSGSWTTGRRGASAITEDARHELMERALPRWTKLKRGLGELIEHPAVEVFIIFVVFIYGFLVFFQMLFSIELHPRGFPSVCPTNQEEGGSFWNPTSEIQCCLDGRFASDWSDGTIQADTFNQRVVSQCNYSASMFAEENEDFRDLMETVHSLNIWDMSIVGNQASVQCDSCAKGEPFCACPTVSQIASLNQWSTVSLVIEVIDFVILGIFLIEITAKTFAFGKPYICDPWNAFDAFIVLLSISLAILNLVVHDETVQQVLGLRGVLRLLRIVLIFRRVSEAQSSSLARARKASEIASPVERVLDLLDALARSRHFKRTTRWALHSAFNIIQEGNLYEITTGDVYEDGEYGKEVKAWIDTGTQQKGSAYGGSRMAGEFTSFVEADTTHNKAIEECLTKDKLCEWGFDIWHLDRLCGGHGNCLPVLTERVLICGGLWKQFNFDSDIFKNFICKIRDEYRKENPYHNALHGADVCQTVFWLGQRARIAEFGRWSSNEYVAMTLGAACHDVGHPGYTNVYCNKTDHHHALLYNDKSTLENYHVAFTYSVICEQRGCNIFGQLPLEDFKSIRESMIAVVLSTDMTNHFGDLAKLKTRMGSSGAVDKENAFPKEDSKDDKLLLMSCVMHAADISNPTKSTAVYLRWTKSVLKEFFNQGDMEKAAGVPVSMFMDRKTTNIAKMQMGFIDIIVKPLYSELGSWLEKDCKDSIVMQTCCGWLSKNRDFWVDKVDQMEAQMLDGAKGDGQNAVLPAAPKDSQGIDLAKQDTFKDLAPASPMPAKD